MKWPRYLRRRMPLTFAEAEEQGWRYVGRGGRHPMIEKDGRRVAIPGTPGDRRSDLNCRAMLRRTSTDEGARPCE